ncbi:DMT family transporter [Hamadaea tsunoensis]|uniref:DMT family transporter n=1 Tax=Hamadaea tsunoensis TaxID=53368 RepID=UPI0003FE3C6B|nr:EamA family transporter [Hamadaea tsunoensis]
MSTQTAALQRGGFRMGVFFVTVAAVAWGVGGIVAAVLYKSSGLGPLAVSFWRAAFGVVVLAGVQAVRRKPMAMKLDWPTIVVGLGVGVYQSAYYGAIAQAGVSVGTVATLGACPVMVALGSSVFLRERLRTRTGVAIGVAVAGLVLLVGRPGAVGPHPVLGVGLALLSAAGYALVTLVTRARKESVADELGGTLAAFYVATVCLLPLAAVEGIVPRAHLPATVGWLLFLGAVPTALAYALFFVGLKAVPATLASVIVLVEPVSALALAVALLHERLAWTAVVGAALMLGAVFAIGKD